MSGECWMCQRPIKGRGVDIVATLADPATLELVKGVKPQTVRVCRSCAELLEDDDASLLYDDDDDDEED